MASLPPVYSINMFRLHCPADSGAAVAVVAPYVYIVTDVRSFSTPGEFQAVGTEVRYGEETTGVEWHYHSFSIQGPQIDEWTGYVVFEAGTIITVNTSKGPVDVTVSGYRLTNPS